MNGQGRKARLPLWVVSLLALVGFIATISAGLVGLLWVALVSARLALIGRDVPLVGSAVRQALVAIAIGVTPQMLFLIYFNAEYSSADSGERDWEAHVAWYEELVYWLNDHLHKFLLPSFYIGAPVALLMFWLTIRSPRLRAAWNRVQGIARFVGIALVAAGTFTLMSTTAEGHWQPDTRARLQAQLAEEARGEMREALYRQTALECSQPHSQLLAATLEVENNLRRLSDFNQSRARSVIVEDILNHADLPSRVDRPTPELDITLSEAAKRLPAAEKAAHEATERAKAAHEQLAQLISDSAMAALGHVVELGLLEELLDGVSERLADEMVASHRSLQKLAEALADIGASGPEAIRRAMVFRPSAVFTKPLRQAAVKTEKKKPLPEIPTRDLPRLRTDPEPSWRIEDLVRSRAEFHPIIHGL